LHFPNFAHGHIPQNQSAHSNGQNGILRFCAGSRTQPGCDCRQSAMTITRPISGPAPGC
jgi:hypothetical protein